MAMWYKSSNILKLKEVGIDSYFPWGEILQIHVIGDFHIVEYRMDGENDICYQPYVNAKDSCRSADSLDAALLVALEYKYLGLNSQFSHFASKMLGIS